MPSAPERLSPPKTVAVLLSTMRSGSTLLKALLATAPDISDLPETDFQRPAGPHGTAAWANLAPEPILVLKRPAWFHEIGRYPRLPAVPGLKRIVLVRDAYANLASLRRMIFRHLPFLVRTGLGNRWLGERYWAGVNARLLDLAGADPAATRLVRYENLLADPVAVTADLFSFLGSAQTEGVDTYLPPRDYAWRRGRDDGGEVIKSLRVQARSPRCDDAKLLASIRNSAAMMRLRRELGYPGLP